eukprot:3094356-Amphidinium_carterae.1
MACRKVVFVLPGTTVPGGSQKDRRRTNASVSLATSLVEKGVHCFLCLPRSSPCLQIPEIQATRARKECQTGLIDLCSLGARTCKEGQTYPMKKQYCVLYLNPAGARMAFSKCTCGDVEHALEQETREQPRPSMVRLAQHLLQSDTKMCTQSVTTETKPEPCLPIHAHARVRMDVLELCGGYAGTSAEIRKLGGQAGTNYDLCVGHDLLDSAVEKAMWAEIRESCPHTVVMSPPCSSFANWSRLNRVINKQSWEEKRRIGERIARICAQVARHQIAQNRCFIMENPMGSDLWSLPCMKSLVTDHPSVQSVCFHQCSYGLQNHRGELLKKGTIVWTNLPSAASLARECTGDHAHGVIAGSAEGMRLSVMSQRWPEKLCIAIAQLILAARRNSRHVTFVSDQVVGKGLECSYPSTSSENVSRVPLSQLYPRCPGCRGHKSSLDTSHTRIHGECRWHDGEEAMTRARTSTSRNSGPRTGTPRERVERVSESRHGVPVTAEAASSVLRDAESTSHAGGSMNRPGLPDEVIESEEARIDREVAQLLRDAVPFDEWMAQKDEK